MENYEKMEKIGEGMCCVLQCYRCALSLHVALISMLGFYLS
jgi:hypothetical protein